jgi:hypothetical protein
MSTKTKISFSLSKGQKTYIEERIKEMGIDRDTFLLGSILLSIGAVDSEPNIINKIVSRGNKSST